MSSKTLREGGSEEESSSSDRPAASKRKAKKGFYDPDYHGFFKVNGVLARFSTYSGVRYVHIQDVVDEKFLTTISGINRGSI